MTSPGKKLSVEKSTSPGKKLSVEKKLSPGKILCPGGRGGLAPNIKPSSPAVSVASKKITTSPKRGKKRKNSESPAPTLASVFGPFGASKRHVPHIRGKPMSRRFQRARSEQNPSTGCDAVAGKPSECEKKDRQAAGADFRIGGAHFDVDFRPLRSKQEAHAAHPRKAHVQEIPKSPV